MGRDARVVRTIPTRVRTSAHALAHGVLRDCPVRTRVCTVRTRVRTVPTRRRTVPTPSEAVRTRVAQVRTGRAIVPTRGEKAALRRVHWAAKRGRGRLGGEKRGMGGGRELPRSGL